MYAVEHIQDTKNEFENVVGQDSLTRFDNPKSNKKRKNNRNNRNKNKTRNRKRNQNSNAKSKPKPNAKKN